MTGSRIAARQRNLTDGGRADARAIGAAIRSLGIPIGEVLASPFCRTRETAELIFGTRDGSPPRCAAGPPALKADRYDDCGRLLARRVPPAT
jgi:phosphohistidine phosphatase SixA